MESEQPCILVIEGDPLMRSLIREWLVGAGYAVREAVSPPGAFDVSLIIVDLYMPRDAGARTVHALRREHPETPVIAVSGQFRPGLAANSPVAQALGATRVLAKPFNREDLLHAVNNIVEPAR